MDVRKNLIISWITFVSGITVASLLEGNWPFLAIGITGLVGSYYRDRLPKQKPERLGEYLERHPFLKWFTVIYLLIVAGLSLNYIGELSELLMDTNIALFVLVMFLPVFILWANEDHALYVKYKSKP
jgi:hypothetical protein